MLTVSIGIWAKYRGRLFSHWAPMWAPMLTTMSLVRVGVHVSEVVSEYIVIMMLPLKALVNPLQYTVRTMKR